MSGAVCQFCQNWQGKAFLAKTPYHDQAARAGVSKMRMFSVQNGFGVGPSVSDGVLNRPSQREGATPERGSKICGQSVQNVKNVNGEW